MDVYIDSRPLNGQSGHQAGRALLAQLYRHITGQALPPIALTPRGKPYFPDDPWHFSISHTKEQVFCALARRNLGIDAESLGRQIDPRLARKILSASEMEQYLAAEDKNRALLTFWVLKEAAAKYTGEGLRGYPNHTAFSLSDLRVTERESCLVAVILDGSEKNQPATLLPAPQERQA